MSAALIPDPRAASPFVVGIVGFKGVGKTTLVERLAGSLAGRGLIVRTIKRAHHDVEIDRVGKDSWRHRAAGAASTAVVSGRQWAIIHEVRDGTPPDLAQVVRALGPADVVLVEGWKWACFPKIEVRS